MEIGRRADLVLLDFNTLGFVPFNDPIRQLVYYETGSSLRTVIVNGHFVVARASSRPSIYARSARRAPSSRRKAVADNLAAPQQADRLRPYFEEMHRRAVAVDLAFNAFPPLRITTASSIGSEPCHRCPWTLLLPMSATAQIRY